jgi:hypothetical protein
VVAPGVDIGEVMKEPTLTRFWGRAMVAAYIGSLGILGAPRDYAWAGSRAPSETFYSTDFTSANVDGLRRSGRGLIHLGGVKGSVTKAYLYWYGAAHSTNPSRYATVKLNGHGLIGANTGLRGAHYQAYRADVTRLVAAEGNGIYHFFRHPHSGRKMTAHGASLLVFSDDGDIENNRDVVLFDDDDFRAEDQSESLNWSVFMSDVGYSGGSAFLQLHLSDGEMEPDEAVLLNGALLKSKSDVFQRPNVPRVERWDVTPFLTPGLNTLRVTSENPTPRSAGLVLALIDLPAGAAPPAFLQLPNPGIDRPPTLAGPREMTVNSPLPVVLQVLPSGPEEKNRPYTIWVDHALIRTGVIPAGTAGPLFLTNAFSRGYHPVVFTMNDGSANASLSTEVHVVDNTRPVLNLPANILVLSDPDKNTASVSYTVTATDEFPGLSVISLPPSGASFLIGTTRVNATAVDSSGHLSQGSFFVTVMDSTPPMMECPVDLIRMTASGANSSVVYFTVIASDNQPGVSVVTVPPSGSAFPLGATPVICMATDAAGNTATCSFNITIIEGQTAHPR